MEEEEEESVHVDEALSKSDGSRHIDESVIEDDKYFDIGMQTDDLQLLHKQIQYVDSFHQDFSCLFQGIEFKQSIQCNTEIFEQKDATEQIEAEKNDADVRTNDIVQNDYSVDCNLIATLVKPIMVELATQYEPHTRNVGLQYN